MARRAAKAREGEAGRRQALLEAMAEHLLAHGLAGASLRALGAAAGASDRMLLYYFADKDELLGALLAHVGARMGAMLEAADAGGRRPYAALLAGMWALARTEAYRPYMLLFLDLAAAAGRGEQPHGAAAEAIGRGFAAWVAARLDAPEGEREALAYRLLATLDGLFLLASAGCGAEADAAAGVNLS